MGEKPNIRLFCRYNHPRKKETSLQIHTYIITTLGNNNQFGGYKAGGPWADRVTKMECCSSIDEVEPASFDLRLKTTALEASRDTRGICHILCGASVQPTGFGVRTILVPGPSFNRISADYNNTLVIWANVWALFIRNFLTTDTKKNPLLLLAKMTPLLCIGLAVAYYVFHSVMFSPNKYFNRPLEEMNHLKPALLVREKYDQKMNRISLYFCNFCTKL